MPPSEEDDREPTVAEDPLDLEPEISTMSRSIMAALGVTNEMMQSVNTDQMQAAEIRRAEERLEAAAQQVAQQHVASHFNASQESIADRFRGLIEQARELENLPPVEPGRGITDAAREAIIQRYLMTTPPTVSRPLIPPMVPLRQNIDYNSTARRVFLVDDLPTGAVPDYSPNPPLIPMGIQPIDFRPKSKWPEWCKVGVVVYDEKRNPFKVAKVDDMVEIWAIEDDGSDTHPLRMVIACRSPKELERYSPKLQKSRWDLLTEED